MTFNDFKKTSHYRNAVVIEVFSEQTCLEFADDFPEEELDRMEVISFEIFSGWISVTLRE